MEGTFRSHDPKVAGSNPAPATNGYCEAQMLGLCLLFYLVTSSKWRNKDYLIIKGIIIATSPVKSTTSMNRLYLVL